MIELVSNPVVIDGAALQSAEEARAKGVDLDAARQNTLAARILAVHNTAPQGENVLRIRFDALASHDITYVGIIQTARASGLKEFPLPYALTNCHNSLCAVGGTINEDDHLFGLAAARKYGGIFVPPNLAVIHQYVREMMTQCGGMILGSDSHTRYGALGVMGVGEGGPELVKQLLGKTYDLPRPQVVAVWLEGAPRPGVGPQDVALALVEAVFKSGFVKNKVLEFMGPGVAGLSVEYRCGVDVMTTETTCLSSIWTTDDKVRDYMRLHGREADYAPLQLEGPACYEACIRVDLSRVTPMIALPFHPSNAWPVAEVVKHPKDIFAAVEAEAVRQFGDVAKGLNLCAKIHDKGVWVDQGVIAGCAGGSFENISLAAAVLNGQSTGNAAFSLSVYPASEPQSLALVNNGSYAKLMPPTAGRLTPATIRLVRSELSQVDSHYRFEPLIYHRQRFQRLWLMPKFETPWSFGLNIADWPRMSLCPNTLLLQVASVITDPVTTTDELILARSFPSSNPSKLRIHPLTQGSRLCGKGQGRAANGKRRCGTPR